MNRQHSGSVSSSMLFPVVRLRMIAMVVAVLVMGSSCGVPRDSQDRPLGPNEIAYTPLPEPTTTTTTTSPPVTTVNPPATSTTVTTTTVFVAFPLDVYWIAGSSFRPIRPIRRSSVAATLESAIDALRNGPLFSDTQAGLRSAIPSSDMIESATVQSGTATINLAPSFLTLPGTEQILAIAQIVYTVTNLPGTGLVEFRLGDRPLSVPTSDGQPSRGALSRDDYVDLLAEETPSSGGPVSANGPNATGSATTSTAPPSRDSRPGVY